MVRSGTSAFNSNPSLSLTTSYPSFDTSISDASTVAPPKARRPPRIKRTQSGLISTTAPASAVDPLKHEGSAEFLQYLEDVRQQLDANARKKKQWMEKTRSGTAGRVQKGGPPGASSAKGKEREGRAPESERSTSVLPPNGVQAGRSISSRGGASSSSLSRTASAPGSSAVMPPPPAPLKRTDTIPEISLDTIANTQMDVSMADITMDVSMDISIAQDDTDNFRMELDSPVKPSARSAGRTKFTSTQKRTSAELPALSMSRTREEVKPSPVTLSVETSSSSTSTRQTALSSHPISPGETTPKTSSAPQANLPIKPEPRLSPTLTTAPSLSASSRRPALGMSSRPPASQPSTAKPPAAEATGYRVRKFKPPLAKPASQAPPPAAPVTPGPAPTSVTKLAHGAASRQRGQSAYPSPKSPSEATALPSIPPIAALAKAPVHSAGRATHVRSSSMVPPTAGTRIHARSSSSATVVNVSASTGTAQRSFARTGSGSTAVGRFPEIRSTKCSGEVQRAGKPRNPPTPDSTPSSTPQATLRQDDDLHVSREADSSYGDISLDADEIEMAMRDFD